MTIDYASPTLNQYKTLIRKEANLYGDIRIASVCGDYRKAKTKAREEVDGDKNSNYRSSVRFEKQK